VAASTGDRYHDVRPRESALADVLKFERCPDADNNNERKHPDEEHARAAACTPLEAAGHLKNKPGRGEQRPGGSARLRYVATE
jgi:hypothetical protein